MRCAVQQAEVSRGRLRQGLMRVNAAVRLPGSSSGCLVARLRILLSLGRFAEAVKDLTVRRVLPD